MAEKKLLRVENLLLHFRAGRVSSRLWMGSISIWTTTALSWSWANRVVGKALWPKPFCVCCRAMLHVYSRQGFPGWQGYLCP